MSRGLKTLDPQPPIRESLGGSPLGEESLELMKFGGNMESVTILGGARHDRDLRFKYR